MRAVQQSVIYANMTITSFWKILFFTYITLRSMICFVKQAAPLRCWLSHPASDAPLNDYHDHTFTDKTAPMVRMVCP
jgi:hypothetical protein